MRSYAPRVKIHPFVHSILLGNDGEKQSVLTLRVQLQAWGQLHLLRVKFRPCVGERLKTGPSETLLCAECDGEASQDNAGREVKKKILFDFSFLPTWTQWKNTTFVQHVQHVNHVHMHTCTTCMYSKSRGVQESSKLAHAHHCLQAMYCQCMYWISKMSITKAI
jgi:hypothetical protein